MGVYSGNRGYLGSNYDSNEIVANENYNGLVGSFQIMIENAQNDQALFDAIIAEDFKEVSVGLGVLEESSLELLTEAGVGGIFEKIKDFLKKVWEKIKGLFKSFLAKLDSVFIRDNKTFVNKYRKEVLAKDLSKMKYKYSKPKGGEDITDAIGKTDTKIDVADIIADIYDEAQDDNKVKRFEEQLNDGTFLEELLKGVPGSPSTLSEVKKETHDDFFEDEDTEEGLDSSRLLSLIASLTESSKTLSAIGKIQKNVDKTFSDSLKEIDKVRTAIAKDIPNSEKGNNHDIKGSSYEKDKGVSQNDAAYTNISYGTDKTSQAKAARTANLIYKGVAESQKVTNAYVSAIIEETKFYLKQARRVFAQAAAFNPKSIKESQLFIESTTLEDASDYEVDSAFDYYEV